MAAVFESLPGKRLALLKSLSYLCRYRPSLAIYLATELYLLPYGRKRTWIDCHYCTLVVSGRGWANGDLMPPVDKGGPLVVIDRKPKLWLLILWNVGGAIALV